MGEHRFEINSFGLIAFHPWYQTRLSPNRCFPLLLKRGIIHGKVQEKRGRGLEVSDQHLTLPEPDHCELLIDYFPLPRPALPHLLAPETHICAEIFRQFAETNFGSFRKFGDNLRRTKETSELGSSYRGIAASGLSVRRLVAPSYLNNAKDFDSLVRGACCKQKEAIHFQKCFWLYIF